MRRESEEEGKLVLHHAAKLAEAIAEYIHERPSMHPYGITAVAYAVEMLLSIPSEGNEMEYDMESKKFRRFLKTVHEDVKKILRSSSGDLAN